MNESSGTFGWAAPWMMVACSVAMLGCQPRIDTWYGRRTGTMAAESVNGTAVLAKMFEQAGHRVRSWRMLSPRLMDADVIVWFPDDFEPPDEPVRDWFEGWLQQGDRTLIYVGRDYDAASLYWRTIASQAPAAQKGEISQRLRSAQSEFKSLRASIPATEDCQWFTVKSAPAHQKIKTLTGPWSQGVDAAKAQIELGSPVEPPDEAEVLLESKNVLVSRQREEWWEESQLIVVANGSFLLNLPLVNHEHRKLAGKLVDEVGPPADVVFLESGWGGPPIRDQDPQEKTPTGMEAFFVWPLGYVLLHLAVVGLVFCFARLPIFGLPQRLPADPPSDFGKHVAAVGDLLRRTKDRAYATERLRHYQQSVRGESVANPNHP